MGCCGHGNECKISCSHGDKYEDDCLLVCCTMQSDGLPDYMAQHPRRHSSL
jgi:hypothetical protein